LVEHGVKATEQVQRRREINPRLGGRSDRLSVTAILDPIEDASATRNRLGDW
jgi:hypothetical protein